MKGQYESREAYLHDEPGARKDAAVNIHFCAADTEWLYDQPAKICVEAQSSDNRRQPWRPSMRLHCPHCHNPIEVVVLRSFVFA